MEVREGQIISARIGFEDDNPKRHLSCSLALDVTNISFPIERFAELLMLGVIRFEALKGEPLRCKFEGGWCIQIGHFTKEKWFDWAKD
jgi:hypothetical protein